MTRREFITPPGAVESRIKLTTHAARNVGSLIRTSRSGRPRQSKSTPPAVARRPQRQPARGRVQLAASTRLEWQSGP